MNSMPSLVQKALHDSGYDVVVAEHDGWVRAQVSGSERAVWIRVDASGIWLAMKGVGIPARIGLLDLDTVPLPDGLVSTGRVSEAGELYHALHLIASLQGNPVPTLSEKVAARLAAIPVTEHTAEVRQRIGQDVFREALLELWEGRCALSGLDLPPSLLRASHAKPWAEAIDAERLDPFNGLLLTVHFDALFDSGLMAFDDAGIAQFSPKLSAEARICMGLAPGMRLRFVTPAHRHFLRYHREHVAKI